jgi:hypothetical protein
LTILITYASIDTHNKLKQGDVMKKNKTENGFRKPNRTVEVRVVVPWMIIASLATLVFGLILGWFVHSTAISSARYEAIQIVKDAKDN